MTMFNLTGKVVLITGGYGHLGGSISKGLANQGATTIVLGRSQAKFDSAFAKTPNVSFKEFDVSSSSMVKEKIAEIVEEYGTIDVLINNAYYGRGGQTNDISDEDWAYTLDGALGSVHRCIREVLPIFRKSGKGKIINVSSMYGMVAPDFAVYDGYEQYTNPPHYGAAKAAVIQLTKYYASLLAKENIIVNAVSPGPFPNPGFQESNPGFIDNLKTRVPLGRIGQPDELRGVFVFLSSDSSNYITGQNIAVDGGWTII